MSILYFHGIFILTQNKIILIKPVTWIVKYRWKIYLKEFPARRLDVTAKSSSTKSFNKLTCPKELCNCIHLKLIFEIIYTSFGILLVRYVSVSYYIGWASSPQIHFWPLIVLTAKFGRDFQIFLFELSCFFSRQWQHQQLNSKWSSNVNSNRYGFSQILLWFWHGFGVKFTRVLIMEKQNWEY